MAKKIILKLADIQVYSDVSDNFNPDRLARFATRAQETQLRELLDDALYNKLINDLDASGVPQTQKYIDLVDGKEYTYDGETVEYFGLKPFLTFHWLGLNIREGDIYMSDYGSINFDDNPQDNMTKVSQKTIDRANSSYIQEAISYRNNITRFLNENSDDYPEWISKSDNENKVNTNIITV